MYVVERGEVKVEVEHHDDPEPGVPQNDNQDMKIYGNVLTGETGELISYDEVDRHKMIYTIDISNTKIGSYASGCDDKDVKVDIHHISPFCVVYKYFTNVDHIYKFADGKSTPVGLPLTKNMELISVCFYPDEFGVPLLVQMSVRRNIWYIRNGQNSRWERVFDPRERPSNNRDDIRIRKLLERAFTPANILDASAFGEYRHLEIHPAFVVEISRVFTSTYYAFTHKKKEGGLFKVTELVYKGSALKGIPPSDDLKSVSLYFIGRTPLESALLLVEMISHNDKCTYFHRKNAAQTWSPAFPASLTEKLGETRITNQLDSLKEKRFNGIEKYFTHYIDVDPSEIRSDSFKSLLIGIFTGIAVALIFYELSAVLYSPRTSLIRGFARLVSRCIGRIFPSIVRSRKGYKKVSIE
ncbi:hypothetical protein BEWA_039730 [Theileria equi strain WA]|uniref:Uncharacterized protein n=1 Tax=Theileria equi strain WA TaxID=1537102 RepID=L1LFB0_THEEQ|nr:hypothetical protein BEWA_039730 [Theileria equi strain WA]EKX73935.1 hypothetical protein BEWA_039730 [Theileria equi strain WA]|eukprot:XP_004833387.1 hypothetical protein BEWA_039730 [Theileria equi strain WA]